MRNLLMRPPLVRDHPPQESSSWDCLLVRDHPLMRDPQGRPSPHKRPPPHERPPHETTPHTRSPPHERPPHETTPQKRPPLRETSSRDPFMRLPFMNYPLMRDHAFAWDILMKHHPLVRDHFLATSCCIMMFYIPHMRDHILLYFGWSLMRGFNVQDILTEQPQHQEVWKTGPLYRIVMLSNVKITWEGAWKQ